MDYAVGVRVSGYTSSCQSFSSVNFLPFQMVWHFSGDTIYGALSDSPNVH